MDESGSFKTQLHVGHPFQENGGHFMQGLKFVVVHHEYLQRTFGTHWRHGVHCPQESEQIAVHFIPTAKMYDNRQREQLLELKPAGFTTLCLDKLLKAGDEANAGESELGIVVNESKLDFVSKGLMMA